VQLYGEQFQTYTLHLVCNHLADDAKLHGSLAHHSMFSIESAMGAFRKHIQGNRGESEQFIKGWKRRISIYYIIAYSYKKCNFFKEFTTILNLIIF
jgi:hypothetical protein